MKVAHVNAGNEYGGGLVHIVSLLKELKEQAIDLIVLEEGPVAQAARKEGIKVYVFQQKSRYDLRVLIQLKQFFKEQNYSLIHTHGPRANALLYMMRHFTQAKWVATIHSDPSLDFKENGLKGKVFEWINKKAIKKMTGVIAVSNEISHIVQRIGVKKEAVQVIYNGIAFSEALGLEKDPKTFTLLTIGRLHPIKGYDLLIEALGELPEKNWQLIICGNGTEEKRLKALAQEFQISKQLSFKGWVSPGKIKENAAQSDIMVHPSFSESFPLVLLEAAEQHLPVIATDVGDVRELLKNESMGWLIEAKNKAALKTALEEAYEEWSKKQLVKKGDRFNTWAKQYSISKQAENVYNFYTYILKQTRK